MSPCIEPQHQRPSLSVIQSLGEPSQYSSALVNLSPRSISPSLLKSNPSPQPQLKSASHLSKSMLISLGSRGSKYRHSQKLFGFKGSFGSFLYSPPKVHMCTSYPSGKPSPSVSEDLGSRYSLNPDSLSSGDFPVSVLRSSKQLSKV